MSILTYNRLKELLEYDSHTGVFTNKINRGRAVAGAISGCQSNGYVYITIDGVKYLGHRLAWLYTHGFWPINTLDHRDNNGYNNAILNLREATYTQNNQNKQNIHNTTTYRGVYKSLNKYASHIKILGITEYLGTYNTPEEASFVFENRAREVHGDFYKDPEYLYKIETPPRPCVQVSNTGYMGVRPSGSKFKAVIKINGVNVHLGTFISAEEASKAFQDKKKEIGRI